MRILSGEAPPTSRTIGAGLLVLLGIEVGDQPEDVDAYVDRLTGLRLFNDPAGKLNLSVLDIEGECLVVSNFSLAADTRRGRRPSFSKVAEPSYANELYQRFCGRVLQSGVPTQCGLFQAYMEVESINDGPITLLVDPPASVRSREAKILEATEQNSTARGVSESGAGSQDASTRGKEILSAEAIDTETRESRGG